ncbi:MAG: hypothetical protein JSW61_06540, partial [Candidatus Thorarchaeota archaeon]
LAQDVVTLTITITKIRTEVVSPIAETVYWGWAGNISFTYNDTYFNEGVSNASATFNWGNFSGPAIDLGNGTYVVMVDTAYLTPGLRHPVTIFFDKDNYEVSSGGISLKVDEVATELQLITPAANQVDNEIDELIVPFGDTISILFYYGVDPTINADLTSGYVGGLSGATLETSIYGGGISTSTEFEILDLGNGTYSFVFDSTAGWLFEIYGNDPRALPQAPFTLRAEFSLLNHETQSDLSILVTIIERPTNFEFRTSYVINGEMNITYGQVLDVYVRYTEDWITTRGNPITGANLSYEREEVIVQILEIGPTEEAGVYKIKILVAAPLIPVGLDQEVVRVDLIIERSDYETQVLELRINIYPTEQQTLTGNIISFGTPALFIAIILIVSWTRYFSIPKRLRQINGQISALRKGRVPKPITEAKTRQELLAELFNDTYQGLEIEVTRVAAQMPEESVPVEVPEIGDLLIQLSILTHLSPEELDEFKADISKMRPSEQAAFVKEVINQEAIRAARRDGKTVEEVLEEIQAEASRRVAGEEIIDITGLEVIPVEERVILLPEEEEVERPPEEDISDEIIRDFEEAATPSDKLSQFELEELRKDLEGRGVPAHEIETIMEQARELPRDLVEELVKSLGDRE